MSQENPPTPPPIDPLAVVPAVPNQHASAQDLLYPKPKPTAPSTQPKPGRTWNAVSAWANKTASIITLFVALLVVGGTVGFYYSQSRKNTVAPKPTTINSLTPEEINKLSQLGTGLGVSGQVLNIGADALFRGKANVTGDLTVGGHFNANGPVTLSQLNITGSAALTALNVGSNLNVAGTTTLQHSLTVGELATVGSLNVVGVASVNTLNANSIAVRTLSVSGPLAIGHLSTQGPAPAVSPGSVGSGGTVSISGNDTAGQVNINTGSGPGDLLATVTFRAPYSASVHVQLTAITAAGATSGYYVTHTGGSFQIHAATPSAGANLRFDYFVVQ